MNAIEIKGVKVYKFQNLYVHYYHSNIYMQKYPDLKIQI
jgi:hypothetical protein